MPQQWLPSRGSECIRRGPNRGFCAGPRRVPKPRGEAAELARRLGLGDRKSCAFLLFQPPKAAWVAAAQRDRDADALLWPIEQGRLLRGIGNLHAARKRREAMFLSNRSAKPSPIKPPGAGAGRHPHEGLDIGAKLGTPIRAARGGLVVYSDNGLTGYGNLVILVHPDSSVTLYAHCRATYVFPGQRVERGQIIGEVGETGFARGPHLHFEYRIDGRAADQMPLLELDEPSALAAEGGGHLTTPRTPP
jgi:murein DD-endopeptidase MepM/ murein hydrolase activator NlpD